MASSFGGVVGASQATATKLGTNSPKKPTTKVSKSVAAGIAEKSVTVAGSISLGRPTKHQPTSAAAFGIGVDGNEDSAGIELSIKHAFGTNPTKIDPILAYSVPSMSADKELAERFVFRVGRQVCVFDSETGHQQFLTEQQQQQQQNQVQPQHGVGKAAKTNKVKNILHFSLNSNHRYLSVCESTRLDKEDDCHPEIGIYNLQTMAKFKTLLYPIATTEFVQSVFCCESHYLAALTAEPDVHIVVWAWDKDKIFKTAHVPFPVTRLRASPSSNTLTLTTSGKGALKVWTVIDGTLKPSPILFGVKEGTENFIDHVWLPSNNSKSSAAGGIKYRPKIAVLCDVLDAAVGGGSKGGALSIDAGSNNYPGSHVSPADFNSASSASGAFRRQIVHVFENNEIAANNGSNTNTGGGTDGSGWAWELRQSLLIHLPAAVGGINDDDVDSAITFVDTPTVASMSSKRGSTVLTKHQQSASHRKGAVAIGGGNAADNVVSTANSTTAAPAVPREHLARADVIIPTLKGFLLVGAAGFLSVVEKSLDKKEEFTEQRRYFLGQSLDLVGGTVLSNIVSGSVDDRFLMVSSSFKIMQVTLSDKPTIPTPNPESTDSSPVVVRGDGPGSGKGNARNKSPSFRDDDDNSVYSNSQDSQQESTSADANLGIQVADLSFGGFHSASITSVDCATERAVIVSLSSEERCVRVWNYDTLKCELVQHFRNDEPIAAAVHPSGFQVTVSFKDRLKVFNVLINKLKPFKETVVKNARVLKYARGGHYIAAASGINVSVYDTYSLKQLAYFQGHMMPIKSLDWAPGDGILFSGGIDGNVYGWSVARGARIDVVSVNNRTAGVVGMAVDCPFTMFPKNNSGGDDDVNIVDHKNDSSDGRQLVVYSTADGSLRLPFWSSDTSKAGIVGSTVTSRVISSPAKNKDAKSGNKTSNGGPHVAISEDIAEDVIIAIPDIIYADDRRVVVTALRVSNDRSHVYAGTNFGAVRIYPWPPKVDTSNLIDSNNNNMDSITIESSITDSSSVIGSSAQSASQILTGPQGVVCVHPGTIFFSSEIFAHSTAVVAIHESPMGNTLLSVSEDGCFFVHSIGRVMSLSLGPGTVRGARPADPSSPDNFSTNSRRTLMNFSDDNDGTQFNNSVVVMSSEDVAEHVKSLVELRKALLEAQTRHDFILHQRESDFADEVRRSSEQHEFVVREELAKYDNLRAEFNKRVKEMQDIIDTSEVDHVKILTELENRYEHKLSDQVARYDRLAEESESLKQHYEGTLKAERVEYNRRIESLQLEASAREKKLKLENRRAIDEKTADGNAFKEILDQQEEEYEDELRQLIGAAEIELVSERENILKLQTLVQSKNTKLDQLKKKLIEVATVSKARLKELETERAEKSKLLETIQHCRNHIAEAEQDLMVKEKIILDLRNSARTLENFRFVLDHRLHQLAAERGPITSHIEGLERHITTMYEELVDEFDSKKVTESVIEKKSIQSELLTKEISKLRFDMASTAELVSAFKRDLSNVVRYIGSGKDLDDGVRLLYKRYIRGEKVDDKMLKTSNAVKAKVDTIMGKNVPESYMGLSTTGGSPGKVNTVTLASADELREVEEALIDSAKEAERQKKFVEHSSSTIQHRLESSAVELNRVVKARQAENAILLTENGDLRKQVKNLERKLDVISTEKSEAETKIRKLRRELGLPVSGSHSVSSDFLPMSSSQLLPLGAPPPASIGRSSIHSATATDPAHISRLDANNARIPIDQPHQSVSNPDQNPDHKATIEADGATIEGVHRWIVHNSLANSLATSVLGVPGSAPSNKRASTGLRNIKSSFSAVDGRFGRPNSAEIVLSASVKNLNAVASGGNNVNAATAKSLGESLVGVPAYIPTTIATSSNNKNKSAVGASDHSHSKAAARADAGVNVSKSKGSSALASEVLPPSNTANYSSNASSSRKDAVIDSLSKELVNMSALLDESSREKEMQKLEIARLRSQLHKNNVNKLRTLSVSGKPDTVPMSHSVRGNDQVVPSEVLHADLYGHPSEDDRKSMALVPVTTATHTKK